MNEIKRSEENLTWKNHIKYPENNTAENIGLLFRFKPCLSKKCLLKLYYNYIYTYISFPNIAWGSAYISKLKQINSLKKDAIRIIYTKKYETVRELLTSMKVLNVY